jgi:hypothetical protein
MKKYVITLNIHINDIINLVTILLQVPRGLPVGVPRLLFDHSPLWQDQRLLLLRPRRLLCDQLPGVQGERLVTFRQVLPADLSESDGLDGLPAWSLLH